MLKLGSNKQCSIVNCTTLFEGDLRAFKYESSTKLIKFWPRLTCKSQSGLHNYLKVEGQVDWMHMGTQLYVVPFVWSGFILQLFA